MNATFPALLLLDLITPVTFIMKLLVVQLFPAFTNAGFLNLVCATDPFEGLVKSTDPFLEKMYLNT